MKKEVKLQVTLDEANLILEGLGNLPFARVYGLVAKIQEQASGQLQKPANPGEDPQEVSLPAVAEDLSDGG